MDIGASAKSLVAILKQHQPSVTTQMNPTPLSLEMPVLLTVGAFAAFSASEPLTATTIERRDLGPRDVLVEIKYSGICHSDIHHTRGEWCQERYPLVPGHEIAGIVADIGWAVTKHAVGDRVGVGGLIDSCGHCLNCRNGWEQHCIEGATETYAFIDAAGQLTQGGYSTHIVVTERFVLKIPDSLGLAEAAPLLCAGITIYSPLRRFGVESGTKVAIVGLGGLGHMGIKLANAMGAEVSVLSQSSKKKEDGLRLGADHYYATSDVTTFDTLADSFDLILNTVSAALDFDRYLGLLAANGALVNVGVPAEPVTLSMFSLHTNGRSFTGSITGGIRETQGMLDFCAANVLGADIEVIAADKINEAYERVLACDVRYQFVIDIATL
jgi:uncharacterized zinc-type alcohol dehydrogenase-like protein